MFLKRLPLALLALVGSCIAQEAHPLTQLQGTSRVLMVFAPDTNSANFKRQLQLIERHSWELSTRNTVVVPVSPISLTEYFAGESLPLANGTEQTYARTRYHVSLTDFAVILLNEDGAEQMRSAKPLDIHELTARLDSLPQR